MIVDARKINDKEIPYANARPVHLSRPLTDKDGEAVTGQYSKLETPEAQLEYLLLFVCRSRSASSLVSETLPNALQMPVRPPLSPRRPQSRVPER
jgi:hypothetical protein